MVNGNEHPYAAGMTVASLLAGLADTPGTVAVEVNASIIPRGEFDATPLRAGDRIEIVHFVGGG
jgi:thiamine biosynthesis protein ThiS